MDDKREKIERALGRFELDSGHYDGRGILELDIDALAESKEVIMIGCEVEHQRLEHQYKPAYDKDVTYIRGGENGLWHLVYDATLGTPGRYLFIGVPLEEAE